MWPPLTGADRSGSGKKARGEARRPDIIDMTKADGAQFGAQPLGVEIAPDLLANGCDPIGKRLVRDATGRRDRRRRVDVIEHHFAAAGQAGN